MKTLGYSLWSLGMLLLASGPLTAFGADARQAAKAVPTITKAVPTTTFDSQRTDFRDESIYFMITTRFYDGDPQNNVLCWDNQAAQIATKDPCWRGDFQGIIDKLDYIKALGFTAIWITPVVQNASGYDYHGYHAMDFTHVDCRYQSGDGKQSGDVLFQELIDKAHAKGIKVILDIVLNHTGNFGEENLCKLFERKPQLRNQRDINACMVPDESKLGSDYLKNTNTQYQRRLAWMKNTQGENKDSHNYWHHLGTNWNWDYPSRWWGQIAGDCVDLNTENDAVAQYLVKCYGEFIKMGVDGFRIDTSGHISRLTFNREFIPAFAALGEQYKSKRLNEATFFMYGEVCARYSDVQYRGQDCLSPYFYTWKSPQSLLDEWDGSAEYWDSKVIMEGNGHDGHQMELCEKDESYSPKSDNALMLNGAYHEPDYSEASGMNVIDFPLHYNFNNAASAFRLAKAGDNRYNDATYNVVYVDSHDYSPGPDDQYRFKGDDQQWAENLSLMFTFRGIPCIYYGSEIGFRRGVRIDPGPNGPLKDTGRAYFGGYITGNVTASDFGEYTATGNVAATLNHDLAQHLIRLNKIRQAVPALRKGQWTDQGCSAQGGIAFKRAYKDSYALVALNGGATFTGCPDGTYTDVVTGQKYTGSTITVKAPQTKGQVRVLVKDWKGGQIGEDGPFIYASTAQHKAAQAYDGHEEDGTTWNQETPDEVPGQQPDTPSGDVDDPSKPYTFCAYFVAPEGWTVVKAWVWDANNNNRNYTGGTWPGQLCVKTSQTYQGKSIWRWEYRGDLTTLPTHIIFNNGGSGNGNQTADLTYQDGKCYDINGINTDVTITGIKLVENDRFLNMGNGQNSDMENGQKPGKVLRVYTLDGIKVAEVSRLSDAKYLLQPGVYVCNGRKIYLHI